MADYYSILKKTISGLPKNTAESRKLVFDKARSTIERQLRSLDPVPSEQAIATQLSALESAIEQLEFEQASPPPSRETSAAGAVIAEQAVPRPTPPAPPPRSPAPSHAQHPAPDMDEMHEQFFEAEADDIVESETERPRTAKRPARRSGSAGKILATLIILALLAAGGYGLWVNRDALMAAAGLDRMLADSGTAPVVTDSEEESEPVVRADDGADEMVAKDEVRLGRDGETITEQEEEEEEQAADPVTDSAQTDIQVTEEANTPVEVSPVEEPATVAESPSEDGADPAEGQDTPVAIPAIGQKAYLYEEGAGNSAATRDNAAIVWSTEQETPGEGLPPETVIKGQLEVPGRGLTMDLTIKRNVDESLSASHIIELMFETPPDFSGGNIDTLARFVMKANEQARGEPLVAVPVKIDSGFFMIALNNLEQARESNRRLLLDSSWIDVPLGYSTGRRALVTLEKGATGDEVFREAFADWDTR